MKLARLVAAATLALLSSCTAPKKAEPTAATAATEETPVVETFNAPAASADIKWEEWAAAGVEDAKLDWPAGVAFARGALYLIGTRASKSVGTGHAPAAEIAFDKITPRGIEEAGAYPNRFGECAHAAVAAGPDGKIWFVGGMYTPPPLKLAPAGQLDFAERGTPVGDVYAWAPAAGELRFETTLPVPRGDAAALFAGGKLYVVGGAYNPADPAADNNRQAHRYDPRDGLWTKFHELPAPLTRVAAAVARGGLYVIGGKQLKPTFVTNHVYRYDLEVYKWQTMPALPGPRAGAGAFVVGSYIYVVGGLEAEALGAPPRMALKSYRYDLDEKKWEELPSSLPEGSSFVAFDGSYFYLVASHRTYRGRIVNVKK